MIDIFAKWKDGDLVCVPKKRRGMSKGEYLRAAHVCLRFNAASFPSLSSRELSLLSGITPDQTLRHRSSFLEKRIHASPRPLRLTRSRTMSNSPRS